MNLVGGWTVGGLVREGILVELCEGRGTRREHSRLAPVQWPGTVGDETRRLVELDHQRRSTSQCQPKHGDEEALDQTSDGGGRGVGCGG